MPGGINESWLLCKGDNGKYLKMYFRRLLYHELLHVILDSTDDADVTVNLTNELLAVTGDKSVPRVDYSDVILSPEAQEAIAKYHMSINTNVVRDKNPDYVITRSDFFNILYVQASNHYKTGNGSVIFYDASLIKKIAECPSGYINLRQITDTPGSNKGKHLLPPRNIKPPPTPAPTGGKGHRGEVTVTGDN